MQIFQNLTITKLENIQVKMLLALFSIICLASCEHGKSFERINFKEGKKLFATVRPLNPNATAGKGETSDFREKATMLNVKTPALIEGNENGAIVHFYPLAKNIPVPGKTYTGEIWAKANKGSGKVRLFITGRANGKHYYKRKHFNLGAKWQKLSMTETIPKGTSLLFLRVDCSMGGDYDLTSPRLYLSGSSKKTKVLPKGNLIINGGAERNWYQTGIIGPENNLISGEYNLIYNGGNWKTEKVPNAKDSWRIDRNVKHSGTASFRVERPKGALQSGISFNHVPVGPFLSNADHLRGIPVEFGHPVNFMFWAKAKRKSKGSMTLFGGSGQAYIKYITFTPEWREYRMTIPAWGEKAPGVKQCGFDRKSYALRCGVVQPRIVINGENTVWLDDAKYWMGKNSEPIEKQDLHLKGRITNNPYHYFRRGEQIKLKFIIENPLDKLRKLQIEYSLIDYFGKELFKKPAESIELAAKKSFTKDYEIPAKHNGPITISFQVKDLESGKKYNHNYSVSVIGEKSVLHPEIGMNVDKPNNVADCVKLLKDFGVGSVRCWSRCAEENGNYIGNHDLKKYKEAGIYVLYCISNFSPTTHKHYVPNDLNPWLKTVKQNMILNKGLVDAYEILNEPNIWGGRHKASDAFSYMTPELQTKVIKGCHQIAQEVDPGVKIAGPTVCGTNINWIEAVLSCGSDKYLDIITEHPYRENPESPDYGDDLGKLINLIAKFYKKPVPIFATESGHVAPAIPTDNLIDDQIRKSVSWNIRMQIAGLAQGLKKYFHFVMNLKRSGTDWRVTWMGNPANDFKAIPHPCLNAMYWMGHFIGSSSPIDRVRLDESLRCFIFKKNSKYVAALWKWNELKKTTHLTMKAQGQTPFDMFGNPCGIKSDSILKLELTKNPIYLVSDLPLEEFKSALETSGITGLGLPFRNSINFKTQKTFEITVSNVSNKAISGKCEMLKKNIATTSKAMTFKNLAPGKSVSFILKRIGDTDSVLPIRTNLENSDQFDVKNFNLRVLMSPKTIGKIKIDGDLSDWPKQSPIVLNENNTDSNKHPKAISTWVKDNKIKAKVFSTWNKDAVYLAVELDKKQNNWPNSAPTMWESDSLQVGFDPMKNATELKYGDDDYEYGLSIVKGSPTVYRYYGASIIYDGLVRKLGVIDDVKIAIKELDGKTIYEMEFPQPTLSPFKLNAGNSLLFNLIVNLNDGKKRMGWLEIAPGIGRKKRTKDFLTLFLSDEKRPQSKKRLNHE